MPLPTVPVLEATDLRVDYGPVTAVDGLSLQIEAGQILGLVGPNGAGKTSSIRVLATLLEPTYGAVRICGHDIFEEPAAARRCIGFMPDLAPVNPDLRVGEFLEFYDRAYGMPGKHRESRLKAALHAVGLETSVGAPARSLSRGMTQRLVLAKTLLHEPPFLLLDEPASGLDPLARRDLREILKRQAAEGRSVLISSHILSELSDMCSHIAIMHRGRLRAHGAVETIAERFSRSSVRTLRVDLLGPVKALADWLGSREAVSELQPGEHSLRFVLAGDEAAGANLLRQMIEAGFAVSGFRMEGASLEDVLSALHAESAEVPS